MSYNYHERRPNLSKVHPWKKIQHNIKKRYEPDVELPIGLSKIVLSSAVPPEQIPSRGKYLPDRRIKIRPGTGNTSTLNVEFNFEEFIVEEVGTTFTLKEIQRVLGYVQQEIQNNVLADYNINKAQILQVGMYKIVTCLRSIDTIMELLRLLSRDRGGQDLESPITDPNVPYWFEGTSLVYSKAAGLRSSDPDIQKSAGKLAGNQFRFEVRSPYHYKSQYNQILAEDLITKFPNFLHHYADYASSTFDYNLSTLQAMEFNISLEERHRRKKANPKDIGKFEYKPFAEQENVDLIYDFKSRLYKFD